MGFRRLTPCLLALSLWGAEGTRQDLAPGVIHLRLKGEGEGLGREHGRLLAPELKRVITYMNTQALGPGSVGKVVKANLLKRLPALEAHIPEPYRAELRGMAQGAGVSYQDLVLVNCLDDLLHHAGCSSVVLTHPREGALLHGRNLDYRMSFMARLKVVVDLETQGRRLRLVTVPGHVGALTGMNDRGLSLTNHTSRSRVHGVGEPTGLLYRRLLETCGTLEEVEAGLTRARRPQGNNLAVTEARSGRAWALEFDGDEVARREAQGGRLFVTNHYWCSTLAARQPGGVPAWGAASRQRLRVLQEALPAETPLDRGALQKALSIHKPSLRWITPANNGTVLSVVMEPGSGRLWMATGLKPPVTHGTWLEIPGTWGS